MNTKLKRYIILVSITLAIMLIYLIAKGFGDLMNYCDATFIGSAVMIGLGALLWVSFSGGFDIFGYSCCTLRTSFSKNVEKDYENFMDYVEVKKEKRKKKDKIYLDMFIVGGLFLIITIILRVIIG